MGRSWNGPDRNLQGRGPYLERRGTQVIKILGDGQLNPFADKAGPADYLRKVWAEKVIDFDVDKRSKDADSCALKAAMWKTSDAEQLEVFRDRVPRTSFDQLIAEWTPQDLVLCSTNAQGALVGNALLERHRERFLQELVPIRFAPPDNAPRRSAKTMIDVPVSGARYD